jgi:hypothetical protein
VIQAAEGLLNHTGTGRYDVAGNATTWSGQSRWGRWVVMGVARLK